MTYTIGDNFQAFDGKPIEIEIDTEETIKQAQVVFNKGSLVKTYLNPTNKIEVTIDETDSKKLKNTNIVELIVYDSENRKATCEGRLIFTMNNEVYNEG